MMLSWIGTEWRVRFCKHSQNCSGQRFSLEAPHDSAPQLCINHFRLCSSSRRDCRKFALLSLIRQDNSPNEQLTQLIRWVADPVGLSFELISDKLRVIVLGPSLPLRGCDVPP